MPSPSKFIATSDLASTPASLSGAKELTLTTPANQYVQQYQIVEVKTEITFDDNFDFLEFIITCDQEPSLIGYNESIAFNQLGTYLVVGITPVDQRKAQLFGVFYSNIQNDTFVNSYSFKAIVIPMKSPYSQA